MKKLIFLLPILIQSAFALNDSGTETNPSLIDLYEFSSSNDEAIYYTESSIAHGISLEEALELSG